LCERFPIQRAYVVAEDKVSDFLAQKTDKAIIDMHKKRGKMKFDLRGGIGRRA